MIVKKSVNDLFDYDGLKIYQYEDSFKFSLDSILLAEFVETKKKVDIIVDFCTGNAPVPFILSTKFDSLIYGFEIQNSIYNLAKLSVSINNKNKQIKIINSNIKNIFEYILPESVDVVTCNPPYFKYNKDSSLINENVNKAIARHEIEKNLEDIMVSDKYILKNKGDLYLVHRCDRLEEIVVLLNKYSFSIKKLQFIYTGFNKDAILVLIKAVKNGKIGSLKVCKPINIIDYKSYKGIFERG